MNTMQKIFYRVGVWSDPEEGVGRCLNIMLCKTPTLQLLGQVTCHRHSERHLETGMLRQTLRFLPNVESEFYVLLNYRVLYLKSKNVEQKVKTLKNEIFKKNPPDLTIFFM